MIEQIHTVIDGVKQEQQTSCPPAAAREFALCITALEDAQMRFVRGSVMKQGRYATADDAKSTIHPDQMSLEDIGGEEAA